MRRRPHEVCVLLAAFFDTYAAPHVNDAIVENGVFDDSRSRQDATLDGELARLHQLFADELFEREVVMPVVSPNGVGVAFRVSDLL